MQYAVGPAWFQDDGYQANSFAALAEIGIIKLQELGANSEIVCGPISTGGFGNAKTNFKVFNAAITRLIAEGHKIFNQMPFEGGLGRLRLLWERERDNTGYCMPILTEFYGPLFETRLITLAHFIPGWESSFGAKWEHDELQKLGARIQYLSKEWIAELCIG